MTGPAFRHLPRPSGSVLSRGIPSLTIESGVPSREDCDCCALPIALGAKGNICFAIGRAESRLWRCDAHIAVASQAMRSPVPVSTRPRRRGSQDLVGYTQTHAT